MSGNQSNRTVHIRPLTPADRQRIQEIVTAAGNFSGQEITTAMELVDESLEKGEGSGYIIVVAETQQNAGKIDGYACYGPTPLTEGVFDLYWIAVDPKTQGRGIGRFLIEYVEKDIVSRGGRMLLIETSSRDEYKSTTAFYQRTNYELAARIKNFYRIGDDKLIFSKELT